MMAQGKVLQAALQWEWRQFEELRLSQLYAIIALREKIFIVEQDAPQVDADGRDLQATHLICTQAGELIAYLRVLPLGLYAPGVYSFGRVVVRKDARGSGLGRELVDRAIGRLDTIRRGRPIKIASQLYLKPFYEGYGFRATGEPYIEDHLWHIDMVRE